jgi:hypothetical protein
MSYYKPELKNPSVALGGFGQEVLSNSFIAGDSNYVN